MKKNIIISTITLLILPAIIFAAPLDGVKGLITAFGSFINLFIRIILGLALIYFFWGIAQFVLNAGDPKKLAEGKTKMVWGIVALFVFLSIFGIIYFIGNTLGIGVNGTISPTQGIIQTGSPQDPCNQIPNNCGS